MQGVMSTPLTVFLELQTVRHVPFILRGGVIPAVALCALECDDFLHEFRAIVPSCCRFLRKARTHQRLLLSPVSCLLLLVHNL